MQRPLPWRRRCRVELRNALGRRLLDRQAGVQRRVRSPNHAVRQVDVGFLALEVKALDIADAEHSTGFTAVPAAPEKSRTASLPLLVSFKCNPAGTPFADAGGNTANQIGWASNWSGLDALADASFTADGTQTVTCTPLHGAAPVALTLKVNPPTLTGGQRDGGRSNHGRGDLQRGGAGA